MSTLSDKLKSLGVQIGAKQLSPAKNKPISIEEATGGYSLNTINGETFVVDSYIQDTNILALPISNFEKSIGGIAKWINNPSLIELSKNQFCFVDIETTGLSGGSGTLAFLIGAGIFSEDSFWVRQFFMRDPSEEIAQLTAFEQFISPCRALVTYNGKSFDAPILNARYTIHGLRSPLVNLIHIDLLHLARRFWPYRLPSRTLSNLEIQILNISRTEEDIPGWMIPQMYLDYLYTGDANPLKRVFYHNLQDAITLVKLLDYSGYVLADPLSSITEYGADLIALAKLFEDIGDVNLAAELYFQGLDFDLPESIMLEAIHRLSLIHKRKKQFQDAINLWKRAARFRYINAHIELAKYYEHHVQEYASALYWTELAIEIVNADPQSYKKVVLDQLNHRLERIYRLMGK